MRQRPQMALIVRASGFRAHENVGCAGGMVTTGPDIGHVDDYTVLPVGAGCAIGAAGGHVVSGADALTRPG